MKKIGDNVFLHVGCPSFTVKLRYDGRYTFLKGEDNRQWTLQSDFFDQDGENRNGSSFFLETLQSLGIV